MEDFIHSLQLALNQPLPGTSAHHQMAPYRKNIQVAGVEPKISAVLGLLYPIQNEYHLVLTKRNEYEGTHSAQVSFPGGKKEEQDEDLIFTAIRETREEIGVEITTQQIIGSLTQVYIPPSNYLVQPILAWTDHQPTFNPDPHEVHYIIELPIQSLLKPESIQEEKITLSNGLRMTVPCFKIKNEIIWGATALILNEIKEILKGM